MPVAANHNRRIVALAASAAVFVAAAVLLLHAFRSDTTRTGNSANTASTPRPAAGTPRGVIWDLWHAAMADDVNTVRAAFHATTDAERRAADALADLLVAESRFARQLRHTWPVSPTSRAGAGTWFGDGGDTALFAARESIDPASVNATVTVQGTPVKLARAGGAWKIDVPAFVRTKRNAGGGDYAAIDLAAATERVSMRAEAYRDLTREVAALRMASPATAMEKLRREMPPTRTTTPTTTTTQTQTQTMPSRPRITAAARPVADPSG